MSTRRPRVKAAAILKPRRPQASNEPCTDKIIPSKSDAEEVQIALHEDTPKCKVEQITRLTTAGDQVSTIDTKPILIADAVVKSPNTPTKFQQNSALNESMENKPPSDVDSSKAIAKPTVSTMPSPFRRITTPTVNIVNRRKSAIASDNRPGQASPNYIKSPSYSFARDVLQTKDTKLSASSPHYSPTVSANAGANANAKATTGDDEIFSPAPIDADECFKSPPFMSPIYTRRIDPSMSPFQDIYGDDYTKSPSQLPNNTKIRQRIRPTPCFASRRNSIQGNSFASESEDEQHRRQRHYSTSSNYSNYNPATQQRNYFGLHKIPSRVRTESYSSSISDIPFSKNKRSHRSEEYQRVANAKREFNQRLNGKPPDKSRLTMYDLIYYNPLTNPMTKPAAKGDKNSDTASISSAKTNQSRGSDSVKSEASVKTEKSETTDAVTGPVPQLKLDANGEIILDEKSLVIETTGDKEAREMLANSDVVYDDEFSGTSGFYKRQKRTRDWLPLETLKFYRSLQTIGTDFSVMLQLFPNRSRRDLKLKFKKEEKHNMALINKALLHPKEFNVDELKLQFDKEDEEIEQKKQEWAELRKKMATERREQLNASKKRNPNKQLSRSMRSLTDGDLVYANEFVTLPPKVRRNRKRATVDPPDDLVFSPSPMNHNNNHMDTLPQHTYATHKLPSFIEMVSSQKSRQSPNHPISSSSSSSSSSPNTNPNIDPVHNHNYVNGQTSTNIELNGTELTNDEESVHAIDLSTTAGSLVIQSPQNVTTPVDPPNNSVDNVPFHTESTIGQYIAKNPNLTYKGSGDIMNMDIIFENVSIEEDISIGNEKNTSTNANANESALNEIEIAQQSSTVEHPTDSQVEHVNIDGIHYQIITIENPQENVEHLTTDGPITIEEAATVNTVDFSCEAGGNITENTMPVINQDKLEKECTLESSETSNVAADVPADVPAAVEVDNETNITSNTLKQEPKPSNCAGDSETSMIIKEEVKQHTSVQNDENSVKRKRKVVPILANKNKRPRNNNAKRPIDIKEDQQITPIQPNMPSVPPTNPDDVENTIQLTATIESSQTIDSPDNNEAPEQTVSTHETINQLDETATDNSDATERNFMDSLVVVESQDPKDPNRTIHEVFVVDPKTNEMSDKPLDLPEHVIQRIRLAIS